MQTITCAICGGKFLTIGIELKKEELSCGIEKTYYECPHCGFKYTVIITDQEIRELIKKRNLIKGYASIKNPELREQKRKAFERIDKQIKEKLNKLNGK